MGEGLLAWCGLRHLHRRPERPSCLTVMPPDRDWTSASGPLCRRGRLASAAGGRALPGLTNDSPALGGPLLAVRRGEHGGPASRPHTSPRRTPTRTERRIIKVRILRRWGLARIAHLLSLHSRPEASCSRSVRRHSAGVVRVCSVRTGPSGAVRRTRRPRQCRRPDRVSRARCVHLSQTARRVQERVLRGDGAAHRSAPRSYGEVTSSSPITGMNAPMEPSELLTPSPAILTDVRIGYARLSTGGQKLDRQVDALTAAGCRRIFADKKSSKNNLRTELMACHAFLTPGDTLVVPPRPLRPVTPGPRQHGRRTP